MTAIPTAWAVLERAIAQRRPVLARYHGDERALCPHALGWKHGRAKLLAYQSSGPTTRAMPPQQRWRSMFVDELVDVRVADGPWQSAANYSPTSNCFDQVEVALGD